MTGIITINFLDIVKYYKYLSENCQGMQTIFIGNFPDNDIMSSCHHHDKLSKEIIDNIIKQRIILKKLIGNTFYNTENKLVVFYELDKSSFHDEKFLSLCYSCRNYNILLMLYNPYNLLIPPTLIPNLLNS